VGWPTACIGSAHEPWRGIQNELEPIIDFRVLEMKIEADASELFVGVPDIFRKVQGSSALYSHIVGGCEICYFCSAPILPETHHHQL